MALIVGTAIVSIAIFFGAFWWVGVGGIAADVLATTQQAAAAMRDESLDDGSREKAMQRASLHLLATLGSMLVRSAVAVAAAVAPILLAHASGLAAAGRVFGVLSRWETGLATTLVAALAYGIWTQPWRTS